MDSDTTVIKVIDYLNLKSKFNFSKTKRNTVTVFGRIEEGYSFNDFKKVIDSKVSQWGEDDDMRAYLRPSIIFSETRFPLYLNETKK